MSRDFAWHPDREVKNVDGPFYTLNSGCLACMLPEDEAPTLLSQDQNDTDTFFIKQPSTPEEIEQACCAIEVCCVEALRYGGRDKKIIERLGNDPLYCDYNLECKLNATTSHFWGNRFNKIKLLVQYWLVNKIT